MIKVALLCLLFSPGQEEGWTILKRDGEKIEIYRDQYGIPHIFAPSIKGAFYGQGYTQAQDRWQQMEQFRRGAKGETAELYGKAGLKNDIDRRRSGYTNKELNTMFLARGRKFQLIGNAYTAGVNAWLKDQRSTARPWDVTDTLAIGIMMARKFGEAGNMELLVQQIYQTMEKQHGEKAAMEILNDILRPSDPFAPTTMGDHKRDKPTDGGGNHGFRPGPRIDPDWYASYSRELEEIMDSRRAMGLPTYFGSNAWVVAPKLSKSGNAMLYGGPMMGFRTPSICSEVHLNAPGLNVAGMTFPGAPAIMIGFNDNIAWTTTSGVADLVDVYVLELNPDNPEQYSYNGEWKDFEKVEVEIKVKGETSEKMTVYRSVYGPLAGKRDLKNNRAHTLAMSFWKRELDTFEAVWGFNFVKNVKEFEASVRKITTSHNFFVADKEGHIGFWYCGAHPKRKKGHDARFPQPGDGPMKWDGILTFEEWPQSIDPKRGWFGNWNNKPARNWEPSPWGKIFWGILIYDELEKGEKVDLEWVWRLSQRTAEHSYLAKYFLPHLLPLVEDKDLKARLEKWDRQSVAGGMEADLVWRWIQALFRRIMGDELGMFANNRKGQRYLMDPLLYLFDGSTKLNHDWLDGKDIKDEAKAALKTVLKRGLDRIKYKRPKVNFGPKIGRIPSERGRGTYQMAVEMTKDGPVAYTLAAPGQSESPESDHYRDQTDLFRDWKYKKFVFKREDMKQP